jgi:hypothetical protein
VIVGPDQHGVVRHALSVADAARASVVRLARPDDSLRLPAGTDVAHLHMTDKLFGTRPAEAAAACTALISGLAPRVVVGLHDVPGNGAADIAKGRTTCYRAVADAADAVVVSCQSERRRVTAAGTSTAVFVVPLAVPTAGECTPADRPPVDQRIGVLGFVYPDKGHAEAIAAGAASGLGVVALGRCSDGHEELGEQLAQRARDSGTTLEITGFLDDAELVARARTVAVPLVAAAHTSASASLLAWIGAGRRPLVARNEHTAEMAELLGEHITLYDGTPDALHRAVRRALDDPSTTWSTCPVPAALTADGVAAATAEVHRTVWSVDR